MLRHGRVAEVCLKYLAEYMTSPILTCCCENLKTLQGKEVSELYRPKSRKENEIRFLRHFTKWLIYTSILSTEICLPFKEN